MMLSNQQKSLFVFDRSTAYSFFIFNIQATPFSSRLDRSSRGPALISPVDDIEEEGNCKDI